MAVTGSTGRVGGQVARRLSASGVRQRLLVRDADRAPDLPGADAVVSTYADRTGARAALAGAELLFMVSASEAVDRVAQHRSFVDAAAEAGVRHVVYTSFYRAAEDATFTLGRDHWATEQHIRASGMTWTFLRDNLYLDFVPLLAGADGVIRGPAAAGKLSAVAIDDVGAAAVAVLRDPSAHAGRTYRLTGPEALTLDEMARIISEQTGRATRYQPETVPEAYASRASLGAPQWQLDAWVSTYTAIAAGEMDGVSTDVQQLIGRPATDLRTVLA